MLSRDILARWLMSVAEYDSLLASCLVWGCDDGYIKVLKTPDDVVIKLFRLKAKPSSSWFYPYSFRFARNARRLAQCGVPTVEVAGTFFVPRKGVHAVVYPMLQGDVLRDQELNLEALYKLADFVAKLHGLGIYFRGLHLGNIVVLPNEEFGLIDIANVLFKGRPLTSGERIRNLRHLFRREDNRNQFGREGGDEFLSLYEKACPGDPKLSTRLVAFKQRLQQSFDNQTEQSTS